MGRQRGVPVSHRAFLRLHEHERCCPLAEEQPGPAGSSSDTLAHGDICQAIPAHGLELACAQPVSGTHVVLARGGLGSTELTCPPVIFSELTCNGAKPFDHFRIKTCHLENIFHLRSLQREMNLSD